MAGNFRIPKKRHSIDRICHAQSPLARCDPTTRSQAASSGRRRQETSSFLKTPFTEKTSLIRLRPRRASDSFIAKETENLRKKCIVPLRRSNVDTKGSSNKQSEKFLEKRRKCENISKISSESESKDSNSEPCKKLKLDHSLEAVQHCNQRQKRSSAVPICNEKTPKEETERNFEKNSPCKGSIITQPALAVTLENHRLHKSQTPEKAYKSDAFKNQSFMDSPKKITSCETNGTTCLTELRALKYSTPSKLSSCSTEPIVVSSDEEGDAQSTKMSTPVTPKPKCFQVLSPSIKGATKKEKTDVHRKINQGEFIDSCKRKSRGTMNILLEMEFSTVQIGSLHGMAKGCIQFMADSIRIPLKDSQDGCISLSVVTSQLKKYGTWTYKSSEHKKEMQSVICLWVSEAQAQLIQKELSAVYPVQQPSVANEFLIVELVKPLDLKKNQLLSDIMSEIGNRNGMSLHDDVLTCEDVCTLLQGLNCENSFILWCKCQIRKKESYLETPISPKTASEEPKCNYRLCHRKMKDKYSISVTVRPNLHLKEHKFKGLVEKLIVFPPPPAKGGIAVTTEDLECLDNEQFLNDVIIDFYLKYLMLEKAPKNFAERSHIFSSFFYKQLTRKDTPEEEKSNILAHHRRHQKVKTWTRHIDIFSKDFIFVPVNQESHWYLVVICFPGLEGPVIEDRIRPELQTNGDKRDVCEEALLDIDYGKITEEPPNCGIDPEKTEASNKLHKSGCRKQQQRNLLGCTKKHCHRTHVCKRPCILIMDSLKLSSHERTIKLLREYLQVEWDVRRGTQRIFSPENIKGSACRVPLQDNSSDCGIYLLQYVESFLQNPVVHFDLPLQLENWFSRQEVKRKRDAIRDLVLQLSKKQKTMS
ncbi:sentrin-specific protease 7 isoform X1 [Erpetoichthys calabaricus]|uniref:sentrin-specific protease 7 isoform X1 n=1 Tax=Erpetoichthys calabaricus TaxID=27687 RepID=UPI002234A604|nr:sentrin-specific protease 7 isoform X1 [Erpetoichthys calabaricus]